MISVQLLAIAYAIIGALLLYLLVATRRTVSFKIFMVVLLSGLYVSTYLSLKELQGWPVTEDLPKRFRLHWAIITEPDKAQKAVGRIYLWIQPTAPSGKLVDKPRAYYLPCVRLTRAKRLRDNSVERNWPRTRRLTGPKSSSNQTLIPSTLPFNRRRQGYSFVPCLGLRYHPRAADRSFD
jgi:hypothetical protein